ncbi:hypothetical protein ABBQ38_013024 [Trebouxia sp. C0009 RCD-2024]
MHLEQQQLIDARLEPKAGYDKDLGQGSAVAGLMRALDKISRLCDTVVLVFKPFQTLAQPPVYRCRSQPAFAWLDSWLLLGHSPFTWCCVVVLGGIRLLRSSNYPCHLCTQTRQVTMVPPLLLQ